MSPPRRPAKGSRPKGPPIPIPVTPKYASTVASLKASKAEAEAVDNLALTIADLTLDVPLDNAPVVKKPKPQPFRLMALPVELRLMIFGYYFADIGPVVDIEHGNYWSIHRKLALLRVCRRIWYEASDTFYRSKVFRIFPIDGRQSRAKKGLLAKVKPQCRAEMRTLELRTGPGWTKPFRSWVVNDLLGLADCFNVRRLHVYIEIDPSNKIFAGYRKAPGFYEKFCQDLLDEILKGLPSVEKVQFDAHPSVKKKGDMARGLIDIATANKRTICWGPCRGWTDADEEEDTQDNPLPLAAAGKMLSSMDSTSSPSAIVEELAE